jgi:predicted TPR repeat methyltransferase
MELALDEALQKGIEAHQAGEIQEAERLYSSVLEAQPKHPDVNHNMGVLAVSAGKVKEALPFFKIALETNPSVAQFWLSYIDALMKLDRITDAKSLLDHAKAKGAKGEAFDQLNKRISNKRINEIKLQNPPSDQLQSMINLYTQGHLQQALSHVTEMLERFPNSVVLHNIAGASNTGLMQFDAAINSYHQALQINPDYSEAYNNMGFALNGKGDLDAAIKSYKKALKINPDFAEAYYNMGIALNGKGEPDAAMGSYKKALEIKPDYSEAFYNMGIILKSRGDLESSIDNFEQALKISPDHAEAYNNIGNALKGKGDYQGAIDSYNKAVLIKPDYADAFYNMGKTFKLIGQYIKSAKCFKHVLSLDSDDTHGATLELASLGHQSIPPRTPKNYMKAFYKIRSKEWENFQPKEYHGHTLIEKAIKQVRKGQGKSDILDLGCGTGSLAKFLRPYATTLDGIDLSPDMLSSAANTGLYDSLYEKEMELYLAKVTNHYNMVVAAAVMVHFFDLEEIFSLIWSSLKANGEFIFSVFEGTEEDKQLNDFLMYSHSDHYITTLADRLNFKMTYRDQGIHEYHKERPINALIYVFKK